MSLKLYKPYTRVDTGTETIIGFLVRLADGKGLNPDVNSEAEGSTLYLKFSTTEGGDTFEENPCEVRLADFETEYSQTFDRVVIQIHDDSTLKGFQVVKPYDGDFSTYGSAPCPKPYIFTQSVEADYVILYLAIYLPEPVRWDGYDTIEAFDRYVQFVNLGYTRQEIGPTWHYCEVELNTVSGYDPVLEDIIVEVVIADEGGGNEKKGHGTTHGSEGDASTGG